MFNINFDQIGKSKNHTINIVLKTLTKYNNLYINDIKITFSDNTHFDVPISKSFILRQQEGKVVLNGQEYIFWGDCFNIKKINITKL